MTRLTRDETAEPVSRDQILRREQGLGNVHFSCSADLEQDWQPYPVDPYSTLWDDHTYIHTYIHSTYINPGVQFLWSPTSSVGRFVLLMNFLLFRTGERRDGKIYS